MSLRSTAQVTLTGPTCVMPGLTYQYLITGQWDSASQVQVCLTGGKIAGQSVACTANGAPISAVLVIWDSAQNGSVQVTSSKGNASLSINISRPLQGGLLDSSSGNQVLAYDTIAATIDCSAATGGSCSPNFQYQWQQSTDRVTWTDSPGTTSQDCTLPNALLQTVYLRRKTTEAASGLIAYSGIAMIAVIPPTPTTSN